MIIPEVNPKLNLTPFFHPFCKLVLTTKRISGPGNNVNEIDVKINNKRVFNSNRKNL
jgi:hypothetical protein